MADGNTTGVTGMQFANEVVNDYYSKIIKELPAQEIERVAISTPEQTTDSIAKQVREYLQPQYDSSVRERKVQTKQNMAAIDVDASSRGMTPSTWVTDSKSRQLAAEASDIADMSGDYTSTLAQQVASQYENYLNRKAGIDEVNAGNQIEVDKWNSQVKNALEELAYSRALEEYTRNPDGRADWQAAHPKPAAVWQPSGGYEAGYVGVDGKWYVTRAGAGREGLSDYDD